MMRTISFILFLLVITAVAVNAGEPSEEKQVRKGRFSFVLPKKWHAPWGKQEQTRRGESAVLITKDGLMLDRIELRSRPINASFEYTKRVLQQGMQPFETAAVVVDDLQLNRTMKNLVIHENKPATPCGKPGFRIVFSYTDNGTLQYKSVYYGFQQNNTFYTILYEAPTVHYFDTYLAVFEKIAGTVVLEGDRRDRDARKTALP